jgi:hypothetical protein
MYKVIDAVRVTIVVVVEKEQNKTDVENYALRSTKKRALLQ